jgi:hypothetical protein
VLGRRIKARPSATRFPLPATQRLRPLPHPFGQMQNLAYFLHPTTDFRFINVARGQRHGNVVIYVEMRIKRVVFKHHGHVARANRQVVDASAVDQQIARADLFQSSQHPQRGGFAAARGTENGQELAVVDRQVEITYRRRAVRIGLGDRSELNAWHG